ncbi:hypothetical protein [Geobacillus subterraneus]|uniref:hypothetical protein n=1 Tax=Geobacillus subterraneus TaxID=129338 RepID=UPI001615C3CB
MKNKFKHLNDGKTIIFAVKGGKEAGEFYIDTSCFDMLDKLIKDYCVVRFKDGKEQIFAKVNGRYVKLARIIAGISDSPDQQVVLANGNEFDLRCGNLVVCKNGEVRKAEFKEKLKAIAAQLPPLQKIEADSQLANRHSQTSTGFESNITLTFNDGEGRVFTIEVRDREETRKILEDIRSYYLLPLAKKLSL